MKCIITIIALILIVGCKQEQNLSIDEYSGDIEIELMFPELFVYRDIEPILCKYRAEGFDVRINGTLLEYDQIFELPPNEAVNTYVLNNIEDIEGFVVWYQQQTNATLYSFGTETPLLLILELKKVMMERFGYVLHRIPNSNGTDEVRFEVHPKFMLM